MSDGRVFWIQVRDPVNPPRVVKISADIEVGRDCEGGILVDDAAASRRHLRLEPTTAGLVVIDLGSANGTTVDGETIGEPRILRIGSRVQLGETELVVFEGREGSEGTEHPPAPGSEHLSERPSAGARRLNTKAAKGFSKGAFQRPSKP